MSDPIPSDHWNRALESSSQRDDPDATLRQDPVDLDRTRTLAASDSGAAEPTRTLGVTTGAETRTAGPALESSASHLDSWHGESGETPPASARYIPQTTIGRGGMGEVLLAWQPELTREVAVKILRADRRGQGLLEALRQEAGISGRLDHPNVVPVHDAGLDYLVMRHVRGRTFSELLAGEPPLSEAIEVLRKVCDGIAYAHDRGVVHRDLKPSNIMVGDFGQVLVMDWGLALELERDADGGWLPPDIPPEAAAAGTPSYLAPEMARGQTERIGPASDVYLLGAILYRILAGHPPHRGPLVSTVIAAAAVNDYPPLEAIGDDLPQRLVELQRQAMRTDPRDRPTVVAFRDGLVAWLRSTDSEREAMAAAGRGHRRLAEASTAEEARLAYRGYARALAAFEQALAAWDGCRPAHDGRHLAQERYTRTAIANGDLTLAESIADAAERSDLGDEVRTARRQRLRVRATALAVRGALAALILGVVAGTAWFAHYAAGSQQRESDNRRRSALSILTEPLLEDEVEPGLQERVGRAYRAMGLAGDLPAVQAAAHSALLDYARWAADSQRWDLAASLIDDATSVAPDDPATAALGQRVEHARTAEQRRREELVGTRRERLQELCDHARLYREFPLWRDRAAAEILSWDGDELRADVIALLRDDSVLVRRLAADVLGKRLDWSAGPALLPLLASDDSLDREQAWTSLSRLADPRTRSGMRNHLLSLEDTDHARGLAVALPEELIDAPRDPGRDPEAIRAYARERLIYGDAQGYLDQLARLPDLGPDQLATMYRVARWQTPDQERARALATALVAHPAHARQAQAWRIDLALAQGRISDAVELVAATGDARPEGFDPMLPRLIRLRLALGSDSQARELAAAMEDADAAAGDHLVHAGNAHFALGQRNQGQRRYAAGDKLWYGLLSQMRELADHEQHPQARAVARLVLARFGPHREALAQLGRSELALGDIDAALQAETLLLEAIPRDMDGWRLRVDRLTRAGRLDEALAAAERLAAWSTGRDRPYDLERVVVLSRLLDRRDSLHPALSTLGTGHHLARHRWQLVRLLCEEGLHGLAFDLLDGRHETAYSKPGQIIIRDAGEPALRVAWDQFLLGLPELRATGWPGATGPQLAELLIDEVFVLLERARPSDLERAREFVDLARGHASSSALHRELVELLSALAADERTAARDRCRILRSRSARELLAIPWLAGRLADLQHHLAGDAATLPLPAPLIAAEERWTRWPRRPITDVRLDEIDAQLLRDWWSDRCHQLVPLDQWTVEGLLRWDRRWEEEQTSTALELLEVPPMLTPGPSWSDLRAAEVGSEL